MEKKETMISAGADDHKIYEVGFHLLPIIAEGDLGAAVTVIRDIIDAAKGKVIADEYPKHLELAYPMMKIASNKRAIYHASYFGWFKFEAEPGHIKAIEAALKKNDSIIRFILVKTVRENTMVPKKVLMQKRGEEHTKTEEKVEEKPQLTPEELDKTIEDLVIS